eukprot:13128978-Alexandrium_andersonii.AAC.1
MRERWTCAADEEVRVPALDCQRGGRQEHAVMDIVARTATATVLVDVVIACVAAAVPQEQRRRAVEPGRA